jgi:hypothetical protein
MSIELTPIGGSPVRNSPDEIVAFARLTYEFVQPDEVQNAIYFASDQIEFMSPTDEDDPRSGRVEAMRKRAEAYLAVAELYEIVATNISLTTPPKQLLQTNAISIGSDFPTPTEIQSSFQKTADRYREQGLRILRMIQPITASIEAGFSIDDE